MTGAILRAGGVREAELLPAQLLEPSRNHDSLEPAIEGCRGAKVAQRAPRREEYLLREVVAERGLSALSIHEAAHARVPAPHDLRERLVVARARERDHESIGGCTKLGRR